MLSVLQVMLIPQLFCHTSSSWRTSSKSVICVWSSSERCSLWGDWEIERQWLSTRILKQCLISWQFWFRKCAGRAWHIHRTRVQNFKWQVIAKYGIFTLSLSFGQRWKNNNYQRFLTSYLQPPHGNVWQFYRQPSEARLDFPSLASVIPEPHLTYSGTARLVGHSAGNCRPNTPAWAARQPSSSQCQVWAGTSPVQRFHLPTLPWQPGWALLAGPRAVTMPLCQSWAWTSGSAHESIMGLNRLFKVGSAGGPAHLSSSLARRSGHRWLQVDVDLQDTLL